MAAAATAAGLNVFMEGAAALTQLRGLPVALLLVATMAHLAIECLVIAFFGHRFQKRVREGLRLREKYDKYREVPAEVIMSLKGADPALFDLVKALARQTHHHWHLRIIIDSTEDPAWPVVQAAVAEVSKAKGEDKPTWSSVTIEPLEDRMPKTGVRLGASLRQHLTRLHPESAVACVIDGDAGMEPDQITNLVAEVQQPGIGVCSGVRFIDLASFKATDYIRALWNIGCCVLHVTGDMPWGGIMAVRREVIEQGGWLSELKTGFSSDGSLLQPLHNSGWGYSFVPGCTSIEVDPAPDMQGLTTFLVRQSFGVRVHHKFWFFTHFIGTSGALLPLVAALASLACCAAGVLPWSTMLVTAAVLLVHHIGEALVAIYVHEAVRAGIKRFGINLTCSPLRWAVGAMVYVSATKLVSAVCTWTSAVISVVNWRGVHYRREGRQVRLIRDEAEEKKQQAAEADKKQAAV